MKAQRKSEKAPDAVFSRPNVLEDDHKIVCFKELGLRKVPTEPCVPQTSIENKISADDDGRLAKRR